MIPAERSHLHVAAQSHAGMSGKNNEDRYAVSAYRLEGENPIPVVLAIVSDGIGGHRAGEVAAEIVVETISQAVATSDASLPVETLREAIIRASQEILAQSESDPDKKGMGATCVCACIIDDRLYAAYAGDSRIYLIRGDKILQLSIDHTWIQEAIDLGILDPEQANDHPNAHVIRRYLGSRQPVEPDTRLRLHAGEDDFQAQANQGLRLMPGDQIVLCSDGLTDLVNDHEILATLKDKDQDAPLSELIDQANQRGGHDNITIITLQVPVTIPEAATVPVAPKRQWSLALTCLTVGLFLGALILLLGGAYLFLRGSPSVTPLATPISTMPPSQPAIVLTNVLPPSNTPLPFDASPTPSATITPTLSPSPGQPSATSTAWPTNTTGP